MKAGALRVGLLPASIAPACGGHGVKRIALQAGGALNGAFLRAGLTDLAIAPVLVGGADTPTAIGGTSLPCKEESHALQPLELLSCQAPSDSYVRLRYRAGHRPI